MRWIINIDNKFGQNISKCRNTDKAYQKYATNEFWCFRLRNRGNVRKDGGW